MVTPSQPLSDKIATSFGSSLLRADIDVREVSSDGEEGETGDEVAGASS